jgi:hypothetical protein
VNAVTTGHAALVALALVVLSAAEAAEPGAAQVTLLAQGAPVALSEAERLRIARRVEELMVGCAMSSATEPGLFGATSLPAEWQKTRAGSHLYVRFSTPLLTRRTQVPITEVAIGLQDPSFIGPELTRHGDAVVGHVKCNGHRALALMCATAIRPHLLPGQAASCRVYDAVGEPQGRE